jgi:IclR family transcriptional regulator, pca regulon regulatory protein
VDDEAAEPARSKDFVQSLDRGLAVIRAFSAESQQLTLSEVARATGLSRASARRFLLTLETLGYLGTDGRYFYLRPRVLELGHAYLSSFSVASIAQAHLEKLAESLGESCSASVLDGGNVIYTSRAATNRIMSVNLAVGQRLPAYVTSMGRVLLAYSTPEELDEYFRLYERPKLTPRTVTDEKELRRILDTVRRQGWAIIDQELELGVRSVAVPVRDASGRVLAATNVSAHASRVSLDELESKFLPRLMRTVKDIEADLVVRR